MADGPRNRRDDGDDSYHGLGTEPHPGGAAPARAFGDWGRPFDSSTGIRGWERPDDFASFGQDLRDDGAPSGHRGKGPRGYARTDQRLHELVCDALAEDDTVDATDVEVTVQDGEVTLDGTVDSRAAKRAAEDCADRISGVRHVQNNLRVRPG